jgi:hypothetical protein
MDPVHDPISSSCSCDSSRYPMQVHTQIYQQLYVAYWVCKNTFVTFDSK